MDTENQICENLHEVGCIKDICTCNNGTKRKIETLEEAAENYSGYEEHQMDFKAGAKWQAERMYSESEVLELLQKYQIDLASGKSLSAKESTAQWFEQFKKNK